MMSRVGLATFSRMMLALIISASGPGPLAAAGDSTAEIPQQVTVSQGVIYLAGHRFTAPLTIGYCGGEFSVNRLSVEPDTLRRSPSRIRKAGDSRMWELEKRAHKISQEGRRKGRPFDETLRRILELYRASPIVASADLRGDVITIHYVGSRIRFMSQFSKDVMLEDPAPGYFERRSAKVRYESLLEMRRYLSSGSLIVHTGRAYTILPPQDSMEIDRIIQKMLAGAALGEEERVALDRDIPEFVMRVPSGPKRLRAVADCRD